MPLSLAAHVCVPREREWWRDLSLYKPELQLKPLLTHRSLSQGLLCHRHQRHRLSTTQLLNVRNVNTTNQLFSDFGCYGAYATCGNVLVPSYCWGTTSFFCRMGFDAFRMFAIACHSSFCLLLTHLLNLHRESTGFYRPLAELLQQGKQWRKIFRGRSK